MAISFGDLDLDFRGFGTNSPCVIHVPAWVCAAAVFLFHVYWVSAAGQEGAYGCNSGVSNRVIHLKHNDQHM